MTAFSVAEHSLLCCVAASALARASFALSSACFSFSTARCSFLVACSAL